MTEPRIKTTVVGSYPFPDWLGALPSEQALIDATRVVIHTQEQAGIDLVCDGELYRFDVNHPETNGMIEYFVRADGRRAHRQSTFDELVAYRAQPATKFRTRPPAVVEGPIGPGTLDLPQACARAKRLADAAVQVHADRPAHAGEDAATTVTTRTRRSSRMAIADVLAEQVKHLDADVVQVDEANLPGSPDEWEWAAEAINRVLDAVQDARRPCICASATTAASRSRRAPGRKLIGLSQRAARRPHRDGDRAPPGGGARGVQATCGRRSASASASSTSSRPRSRPPTQIARAIERAEKVLGAERVKYIHPDCGFWMLKRNIADGKIRALVQGRDLYEGRLSEVAGHPALEAHAIAPGTRASTR